ncbi:carcinoembryonic antigen-related cell adhesion molecule 19-like isoform X3 [Hyperolius riggenbachi]|uniref:carcinoembryonic antigen-related cell adhesion molecule 19-like isoform X3 n=1 Tax=Hyperolius riggenbachi TaxID=752182 RepID=UPI0035A31191
MIYQQRWLCLRVISALLSVWMGVASGETLSIQLIPQHPVIRGSVTLRVTGVTGGDIRSINWYRGAGTLALNQILAYIPSVSDPVKLNGPMYHNRIEAFPNASLLISSLERTDEGDYTVQVQTDTAQQASVTLTVYAAEGATDSLSNGIGTAAIIGIVVAMVLLVALTAAIVLLLLTQRRRKKALESRNSTSMAKTSSRNGTANASTPAEAPELQYADINFRTNMGRQKQEQEQPELQYAEVNISKNMGKNKQEAPELQYADIDFSKNMGKKKQPSPDSPYANSGAPQQPPPDAVVYSELRRN